VVAGRREEGKKEEEKEGQKIVGTTRQDKRGDNTYRYRRNQADWLRNHGYLRVVPNL